MDVTSLTKERENNDLTEPQPEYFNDVSDSSGYGAPQPFASNAYDESAPAPEMKIAAADVSGGPPGAPPIVAKHGSTEPSKRRRPEIRKPKVELRNYFPETWLFDMVDLDSNGEKTLSLEAPHTITTWVAETVCTDSVNGVQVSNLADLLVTQDFFADLNMPYSIKRGEEFPLNVSVFNTIEQKLPITITIMKSPQFKVGREEQAICINADDNQINTFAVKAKELNEVNITVEAKISASNNKGCNDEIGGAEGYSDTLQKSIQVKPEGFPVEKVQSEFVCRKQNESASILNMNSLTLPGPEELVNGSARAWTTVTGDIMAPALSNLERLLQQPTGCGEQVIQRYE